MPPANMLVREAARPSAYAGVALIIALIVLPLFFFAPVRVGDGSEYYALYLAIKSELRPWMTAAAFSHYDSLVRTDSIEGLVTADALRDAFPALRVGGTADFNHFWIYSLISAVLAKVLAVIGIHLGTHQAFMLQHALLLIATSSVALRLYGKNGVYALLLLTLASPIIWFTDKVHTEFFSYCFVMAAVMLAYGRLYLWGALCLAVASTQNPSFALLAFVLLLFRLLQLPRRPFQFWEAFALVGTCVAVLIHPAYYFFRYGVLTPQMLAGGAKMGANASTFYVWILDPDVGLLPNWPLSIVLIVAGLGFLARGRRGTSNRPFAIFVALYLIINLFAQSSTTNINSGATPGLSRYALWYIPLFFPLVLAFIEWAMSSRLIVRVIANGLIFVYAAANAYIYDPRQHESYSTPTPLSKLIQEDAPSLYNPPEEVFAERFSGYGETEKTHKLSAILGPSCDKLLIIPGRDTAEIASPAHCLVDDEKLRTHVRDLLQKTSSAQYVRVHDLRSNIALSAGTTYETRLGRTGSRLLGNGWHAPEEWGVWSGLPSAEIKVPCPSATSGDSFKLGVSIVGFGGTKQSPIDARVRAKDGILWSGAVLDAPTDAVFTVKKSACSKRGIAMLSLEASELHSPKKMGLSSDTRKLGIGLRSVYYP